MHKCSFIYVKTWSFRFTSTGLPLDTPCFWRNIFDKNEKPRVPLGFFETDIYIWRWLFHPSTVDTQKKVFFDPKFESYDQIVWDEKTSDDTIQAPTVRFFGGNTYGPHQLPKVLPLAKMGKNAKFWKKHEDFFLMCFFLQNLDFLSM